MNNSLFLKLMLCVFICGIFLYAYSTQMVQLTRIRMQIPTLTKELHALLEDNNQLKYQIDQFENPLHLMELARHPQFGHLKFPNHQAVVKITALHLASAPAAEQNGQSSFMQLTDLNQQLGVNY